jgi:hypothetical protein
MASSTATLKQSSSRGYPNYPLTQAALIRQFSHPERANLSITIVNQPVSRNADGNPVSKAEMVVVETTEELLPRAVDLLPFIREVLPNNLGLTTSIRPAAVSQTSYGIRDNTHGSIIVDGLPDRESAERFNRRNLAAHAALTDRYTVEEVQVPVSRSRDGTSATGIVVIYPFNHRHHAESVQFRARGYLPPGIPITFRVQDNAEEQ